MADNKLKIDHLSLEELLAIRKQIEERIRTIAADELEALRHRMAELAPFAGGAASEKAARSKAKPKYRDPKTGATWSGRGRTPAWVTLQESKGRDRSEFQIAGKD